MARTKQSSARRPAGSSPPVTPDGRYLIVRGRLWRHADPSLTEDQRQRAVSQLMQSRRAVRDADGPSARARARAGVERAKRALGERGGVWWTDGAPDYNRHLAKNTPYAAWFAARTRRPPGIRAIEAAIVAALRERSPTASACPSEIARRLAPGTATAWRPLMPRVREAVARLCQQGRVRATRGAEELKAPAFGGGPIRIRRGPSF